MDSHRLIILALVRKIMPLACLVVVLGMAVSLALAASGAWNVDSDGNWNDNANWDATPFPNGTTDIATFGSAIGSDRVVTIDGVGISISELIFDNANSYTVAGAGSGSLTFAGGGNGQISVTSINGSGAHTIALPVVLDRNLSVDVTTATTLTIAGSLSQLGPNRSLTKNGAGTLVLSVSNSYGGNTTVSAGTLALGNNAALGNGTLVPSSNSTVRAEGGARVLANNVTINNNVIFEGDYLGFTNTGIQLPNNRGIIVNNTTSFAKINDPAGTRSFRKTGSGTLNLNLSGTNNPGDYIRNDSDSTGPFNLYGTGTTGRLLYYTGNGSRVSPGDTLDVATGIVTANTGVLNSKDEITLHQDTTLDIDLNSSTDYDQLTYNTLQPPGCHCVNLNDATLDVDLGFTPDPGDIFTIISRAGGSGLVYGNFQDLPQGSVFMVNGAQMLINYMPIGDSPTEVRLTRVDIPLLGLEAIGGSGQSTGIGTDFAQALEVTVTDQNGDPVPNALVIFEVSGSGASATFPGGNERLTDASGVVTVTVRANNIAGSYNVTANISPDAVTPAAFVLTNTAPALSIDDPVALESAGLITFTVTMNEPASLDVTVTYSTSHGTATGADYIGVSGLLTVTTGLTEAMIPVTIFSNAVVEGDRSFSMTLSNPVHAVIAKGQGIGTILDDDVAPGPESMIYLPVIHKNYRF